MQIVSSILQVIVALVLLDVWLLRFKRSTPYRGGDARTMKEEFAAYGLPAWTMYVVGALKVGAAVCLLVGLWIHSLVLPAAALIALLMIGAIAMHLKIHDPAKKSLPAGVLLLLSLGMCLLQFRR